MSKILAIDSGNVESGYSVYKHTNITNNKCYIGITNQRPVYNRWRKNGVGYRECIKFYNAIKKYGWDNFKHEILFKNLTKQEAENKEIELIAHYKSNNNKYGYNIQNGGNCAGKMSEETKCKISKKLKGKRFTEEHKAKISNAQLGCKNHMYGKKLNDEVKNKIRQGNIIHPSSGQFPSRKINQYDLNGIFIKTWNSMGEIERKLKINHSMISECCNNKQKTSGGYIWKYCL